MADLSRVGPHGYVHGWIFVGAGGLAKNHGLKPGDRIRGHHPAYGDFEGRVDRVHRNGNLITTIHSSKRMGSQAVPGVAVHREDVTHVGKESAPHLGSVEHAGRSETFAARWAGEWTSSAQRFNHNHGAAGSGHGGQFVAAGGGGSKSAKPAAAKASGSKSGSGKPSAHQEHEAHVAHEQHVQASGARARQKRLLHAKAEADRAQARKLETELHGLQRQEKAAQITAKKSAAAAKPGHQARVNAAKKAAQHRKASTHHASLKTRIGALQTQIKTLLTDAKALDAQAARL